MAVRYRMLFMPLAALAVACGTSSTSTSGTAARTDGNANGAENGGSDASAENGGIESNDGAPAATTGVYDCAWVRGPNCWKTAAASAVGCLPPASARGVYSANGATCTYSGGIVITFMPAMVLSMTASVPDFTLTNNGVPCLRYAQTSAGTSVTMPAGTVTFSGQVDGGIVTERTVTCPDGTAYSGPAAALASCSSELPYLDQGLGGFQINDAAPVTTFSTGLNGAGGDGGLVSVFACNTP